MRDDNGLPTILIPYPGSSVDSSTEDIFVYLRPESNGYLVESIILKVIQKNPEYKHRIFFVYLANIPGEFILEHHIIEKHYLTQFKFAVLGGKLFTPCMQREFETYFQCPFGKCKVVGAFEALRLLSWTPEQLFRLWVPQEDVLSINGQTIKRYKDLFIVNYDIPAILQKHERGTDIAVMLFRTSLGYSQFEVIFQDMEAALRDAKVLPEGVPVNRLLHYSKGPFEQILDGRDYLYAPGGKHIPCEQLSFAQYLLQREVPKETIRGVIEQPIVQYRDSSGSLKENSIFLYTRGDSYGEAYRKFLSIQAQVFLH
ncbi:MAG: hypothetical protein SNJ78_03785 [Spirochaetales bacterium]